VAGGRLSGPGGSHASRWAGEGQEWEINIANPARAAATTVPMSAACTNGIDLRKALRIDCSRLADC
jgi:hypothetical protein